MSQEPNALHLLPQTSPEHLIWLFEELMLTSTKRTEKKVTCGFHLSYILNGLLESHLVCQCELQSNQIMKRTFDMNCNYTAVSEGMF